MEYLIIWFEIAPFYKSLPPSISMVLEAEVLEIHYPSSYGFSGITVDEISERQWKEENEDLAVHPAAFHPAVLLSTRSFGRQQSSEGRSAVGGLMVNGAIIENLIKMLKKLSASSQLRMPPHCPAPNPIWNCGNAKKVWQQRRYCQQWCKYCRGGQLA